MNKPNWASETGYDLNEKGKKIYWADIILALFPHFINPASENYRASFTLCKNKYRLRYIPPGEFEIGNICNAPIPFGSDALRPCLVHIHNGFFIGETTISRNFYNEAIECCSPMSNRGLKKIDLSKDSGGDLPCNLDWYEAQIFALTLSQQLGCDIRLPTEMEWEYACRAGTQTNYYFGNQMRPEKVACNFSFNAESEDGDIKDYISDMFAGKLKNESILRPVYSFEPNAFGLYQMHGNVNEWCMDRYRKNETRSNRHNVCLNGNYSGVVIRGGIL